MTVRFFDTIRGVEVEIEASEFDGDESVGISYGPECMTASRLDDGSDYELTDEEIEKLGIMATEIVYEGVSDFDWD